jgi:hypothetical protein
VRFLHIWGYGKLYGLFLENCRCATVWPEVLNELFVKMGSNYQIILISQSGNIEVVMGEMPICKINMFVAKKNI